MDSRKHSSQRGVTLLLLMLSIIVLFAIAAMAVDLGILYTARTSAQHAADAAALAGAFTFVNTPTAIQPQAAQTAAASVASGNSILNQAVQIDPATDVQVDEANRLVTVTVRRQGATGISTYFARAFGIDTADVVVRATAEASSQSTGSRCIKPIYIPNTVYSNLPPADACEQGEVLFDANGNLTAFGASKIGGCALVRPTVPSATPAPGQFYSLDLGTGAETYRCVWSSCLSDPSCNADIQAVQCGNTYPVKTGNMNGPTRDGVAGLIGDTPDQWLDVGQYRDASGVVWDTSKSLSTAPVWDNCTQQVVTNRGNGGPGNHIRDVKIIGFAQMFVNGMSNQNGCGAGGGTGGNDYVKINMVSPTGCGTSQNGGGEVEETFSSGPGGVPVRLVRPPSGS
ncbi:MAG: pilus assembly protein TadG-related protein [Candidatus Korobacteraceae bacterium]